MTSVFLFWCFYGWLGTYVKPFSNVSIVDFEQVYGSWVKCDGSNCLKWGKLDLQLFQIQFPQTSFKNNFYFIVSFFVPKVWKILCWCWISEVSLTWLDLKNYHENDRYLFIFLYLYLEELSTEDMNKLAATLKTLLPYYEGNRGNREIWLNYINKWKVNITQNFWWQLYLYLNKTVKAE